MNLLKTLFGTKTKGNMKTTASDLLAEGPEKKLYKKVQENKLQIERAFGYTSDLYIEEIQVSQKQGILCYLGSMVDKKKISSHIMDPLSEILDKDLSVHSKKDIEKLRQSLFSGMKFEQNETFHQVIWNLLDGYAVLVLDGIEIGIALHVVNDEKRSISEPTTQTVLRGPKDGFVESMNTNLSLIRRRIKNPRLRFETKHIGKDSRTSYTIAYVDGIANDEILQELKERISKVEASVILDSGNMEELITDQSFTFFPLLYHTERPDSVSAHLMEGKIGIIVDGSPFVIMLPAVFTDFFQASEDYYQSFFMSSFIRMVRYIAFMLALVAPALYIAVTTFHHELFPTNLLISIQAQREGVPFPAVVEVLLMEITFEILREAGIRMPRAVGQTVSIVGALVIGQAAVEAGLVSNLLIIVVALTAIASFVTPIYAMSIPARLLRFLLIFASASFGLYGILLGLVIMVIHLVSLRSFGVPYLAPVAPFIIEDHQDVFFRLPNWANFKRPTYLRPKAQVKHKRTSAPVNRKDGTS